MTTPWWCHVIVDPTFQRQRQLLLLSGRAGDARHHAVELAKLVFVNRVPRSFDPLLPLFAERERHGSGADWIADSHS